MALKYIVNVAAAQVTRWQFEMKARVDGQVCVWQDRLNDDMFGDVWNVVFYVRNHCDVTCECVFLTTLFRFKYKGCAPAPQ